MDGECGALFYRLSAAVVAGGVIGLERAYRGRAAGFRTHILVCAASAILMLVMDLQWRVIPVELRGTARLDPTRIAQGIMTGIGFLGAGVIIQDRVTIRGLTTAASIWVTAAIGILIGAGYYGLGIATSFFTLAILSVVNKVIQKMPYKHYARLSIRIKSFDLLSEQAVLDLLDSHGLDHSSLSYSSADEGRSFEYQIVVTTTDLQRFSTLVTKLRLMEEVQEFSLTLSGE